VQLRKKLVRCLLVARLCWRAAGSNRPWCTRIAGVVKYVAKQEAKAVAREVVRSAASQVWKDLKAWRGKIKTNGLSGKGRRYFTYDPEGEIEVFNRRGSIGEQWIPIREQ